MVAMFFAPCNLLLIRSVFLQDLPGSYFFSKFA